MLHRFVCLHTYKLCVCTFSYLTHSANAVAGSKGTNKGASRPVQHGADAGLRGIELIPNGLADRWHVRKQHHWQQTRNIHRDASHRARTLPEKKETDKKIMSRIR